LGDEELGAGVGRRAKDFGDKGSGGGEEVKGYRQSSEKELSLEVSVESV
jgi:hypothetical protein